MSERESLKPEIKDKDADGSRVDALSREVISAYNAAVAKGEQPNSFGTDIVAYHPIDRDWTYSNIGADTPNESGSRIVGAIFYWKKLAGRDGSDAAIRDPELRIKAAEVCDQIESDWKFLEDKYGKDFYYRNPKG